MNSAVVSFSNNSIV